MRVEEVAIKLRFETDDEHFIKISINDDVVWEITKYPSLQIRKNDVLIANTYSDIREPFEAAVKAMFEEIYRSTDNFIGQIKGALFKLKGDGEE